MAPAYLLLAAALLAGCLSECFCNAIPLMEITDCWRKERAAALSKICVSDKDCEDAKTRDALRICLLYGFNLTFQDSTYHEENDSATYRLVECAFDECFEGVKAYQRQQRVQPAEVVSGLAESFHHCLLGVRECVASETMWDASHQEL